MNSNILLNEALHVDEFAWESLIGGAKGTCESNSSCTCNNGCYQYTGGLMKPGCTDYREYGPSLIEKQMPISIAELSY